MSNNSEGDEGTKLVMDLCNDERGRMKLLSSEKAVILRELLNSVRVHTPIFYFLSWFLSLHFFHMTFSCCIVFIFAPSFLINFGSQWGVHGHVPRDSQDHTLFWSIVYNIYILQSSVYIIYVKFNSTCGLVLRTSLSTNVHAHLSSQLSLFAMHLHMNVHTETQTRARMYTSV